MLCLRSRNGQKPLGHYVSLYFSSMRAWAPPKKPSSTLKRRGLAVLLPASGRLKFRAASFPPRAAPTRVVTPPAAAPIQIEWQPSLSLRDQSGRLRTGCVAKNPLAAAHLRSARSLEGGGKGARSRRNALRVDRTSGSQAPARTRCIRGAGRKVNELIRSLRPKRKGERMIFARIAGALIEQIALTQTDAW